MAYLVTGGTGFIGSWVVKSLLERGHKVVAFDLVPGRHALDQVVGPRADEVTIVQGDFTQMHRVLETVRAHKITHIAHIAAAGLNLCNANPAHAVHVNGVGFANMLEVCRAMDIERMVWASSAGVFGGNWGSEPVPNDAPFKPRNVYAGLKILGETLAAQYHATYGLDVIGLRFTFVNGHGMPDHQGGQMIRELCEKTALGQPAVVPWGDDAPDWLWGGDAGEATALALAAASTKSRAFNIHGNHAPMAKAVAYVKSLLPDANITVKPSKMGFSRFDGSVAAKEIGYTPKWTMEMQLRERINRVRQENGLPDVG
jgi:UDP-glucose 4-epimerase